MFDFLFSRVPRQQCQPADLLRHLSLLLQLLKASCEVIKVDVFRSRVIPDEGGCRERVRDRGKFWESVVVI